MRRAAAIDKNQPDIVRALRQAGAHVTITSQLKKFADIVVVHRGIVYIAEIKDGTKAKSARRLTEHEEGCKESVERTGGTYYILESVRDALMMIGEYYCRCEISFTFLGVIHCQKCDRDLKPIKVLP